MENNETLSQSFNNELEDLSTNTILDPAYRKKKLFFWIIRTIISIILYIVLWKHAWIKWSLILTVPLSVLSLFTIIGSPYLLKRKIEQTKKKIEETEILINGTSDE